MKDGRFSLIKIVVISLLHNIKYFVILHKIIKIVVGKNYDKRYSLGHESIKIKLSKICKDKCKQKVTNL